MKAYYWKPADGLNLGDWLTALLVDQLAGSVSEPKAGEPCLIACGSILHGQHLTGIPASCIHVWGSGLGDAASIPPELPLTFHAVRGPITRRNLFLPPATPIGDPGLLVPEVLDLTADLKKHGDEVLYVSHVSERTPAVPHLADAAVSAWVPSADWALKTIGRISQAHFVLAESLHAAILAQAYGVPWAPFSHRWTKLKGLGYGHFLKWADWLASLTLPPIDRYCADVQSASHWWQTVSPQIKVPDTEALRRAFPSSLTPEDQA